ncbi:MAG: hypothetical protein U0V70_15160 [Terriglobia bacterium]
MRAGPGATSTIGPWSCHQEDRSPGTHHGWGRPHERFPEAAGEVSREVPKEQLATLMPDMGSHPNTRVDAGLTLDDLTTFY